MKADFKTIASVLRHKEEDLKTKRSSERACTYSKEEILILIHQLELYQVELEIQNKELIRMQNQTELALREYSELYDSAPSSYFTLSRGGKIIELNICGSQLLGKSRSYLKNRRFGYYVSEDTQPVFNNFLEKVFSHRIKETCEVTLSINGNLPMNVQVTGIITENEQQCHVTVIDIMQLKLITGAQKFLLQCDYSGSDEDFFESLARYLAESLDMDYVCIDRLEGDGLTAQTVAIYNDGKFDSNSVYSLKETPCGDVLQNSVCCYPEDVCRLFPGDKALRDLKAVSYVGTTLLSFEGKPIGLIEVIGRKPLKNPNLAKEMLKLVAVRAAGELERKRAEDKLRESKEKYRLLHENAGIGIGYYKPDGTVISFNHLAAKHMNGIPKDFIGKSIYDIFPKQEAEIYFNRITKATLSDEPAAYEDLVPLATGNKYFLSNFSKIIDLNNNISGIQIVSHDLTQRKLADQALIESEEKYRLLFDGMIEGFALYEIILDEKGIPCDYRFLSINPGFEKKTGLKAENIIGKKLSDILPEPEKSWIEIYGKVALTCESIEFEQYFPELDSYLRVSVFSHKKGYFATVFEDITNLVLAEKELQKTKNYLENLINYANAPIIVWNPDTEIQLFNRAFEHLTGYSSTEVEGKKLDLLFPKASLKESSAKIKHALTQNWETIEIPILTKNNEVRTVLWNSANIFDSDKKAVVSTIAQGNDITERIKAEQKVKDRTKELELVNLKLHRELTERNLVQEALKKNEAQLKELNTTKDKFFNIVAHDLKNPFTSLLGSSELLFENIDQLDTEKIKKLAGILNDSAKSGYAILQNLLDWSRSQTGLLDFNPVRINLSDLITENISNLQLPAANKEINLYSELDENIYIFADKNLINTVLRNLLSNALKFTYRGGKIFVGARITSDEVIISVKDTGIGISKEKIERLFRIDNKYSMPGTDNEQGTGLGLKLCKEFIDKQGGKIWVESIEKQGSEFMFSIPLHRIKEQRFIS